MNCDFVTLARKHMAIKTVIRNIELTTHEPLAERKLPFTDGFPWLLPRNKLCSLSSPEGLIVGIGFVIEVSANNKGGLLE